MPDLDQKLTDSINLIDECYSHHLRIINLYGPFDIYRFSYFHQFYAIDIVSQIQGIIGLNDEAFGQFCKSEAFAVIEAKIHSIIYQLSNMTENQRYKIKPKRRLKRKPKLL